MESEHKYVVQASSTLPRSGVIRAKGIEHSIAFSAPPEFNGRAGLWTPEHFFVAAVASCYVSTFSGISDISKFEFISLDLETEGILGRDEGGLRFQSITLRPRVKIAREADRERAMRLLQKAEKSCLIARSLSCPVTMEPEIQVVGELVEVGNGALSIAMILVK
jgi:peroxiredoxin-like protein